jgi:serine/threonine-protein kinase
MGATQDWAGAQADISRARDLNPGSSDILMYHGGLLATLGRVPEAIGALEQAVLLDPLSANALVSLAIVRLGAGQLEPARASAARALELAPEHGRAARTLGFALLLQNRLPEARAAFLRSTNPLFAEMGDVLVDHALGDAAAARRGLDKILSSPNVRGGSYQVAEVFAFRGEIDRSFEWLDHAVEAHDAGLNYLKYDPLLKPLRPDPRYRALLMRLKLPAD